MRVISNTFFLSFSVFDRFFLFENRINGIVVEGEESQPSPAAAITPYQRLTNALQSDPRCAQEVNFQ